MDIFPSPDGRWMGIWPSPNIAGAVVVQVAACCPFLLLRDARWGRALGSAALALCIFLLIGTGSRGALVAAVVALACWSGYFLVVKPGRAPWILCCAAVILGVVLGELYFSRAVGERFTGGLASGILLRDYSSGARGSLWAAALGLAITHPLGIDFRFGEAFAGWFAPPGMADAYWPGPVSDPLDLALSHGIAAFALLHAALVAILSQAFSFATASTPRRHALVFACAMVVLASYICSAFSQVWNAPACLIMSAGAALAVIGLCHRRFRWRHGLVAAGVALCWTLLFAAVALVCWRNGGITVEVLDDATWIAAPATGRDKGSILIVASDDDLLSDVALFLGRATVRRGFRAVLTKAGSLESTRLGHPGEFSAIIYTNGFRPCAGLPANIPRVVFDTRFGASIQGLSTCLLVYGPHDASPAASERSTDTLAVEWGKFWPKRFPGIQEAVFTWCERHHPARIPIP